MDKYLIQIAICTSSFYFMYANLVSTILNKTCAVIKRKEYTKTPQTFLVVKITGVKIMLPPDLTQPRACKF